MSLEVIIQCVFYQFRQYDGWTRALSYVKLWVSRVRQCHNQGWPSSSLYRTI